ncbi:MAG: DUF2807 domain-containing protein [Bacteroidota bacterium]
MILRFRYFHIILVFLFAIILNSCQKNNCLSGGGDIVQEERILKPFKYIETFNNFEFHLKNDTIHKVEIEAGGKLIPFIETKVEDSVLTIRDLNKCDFLKGYENKKNIIISVDTLKEIIINNASDLYTVDTFNVHKFKVKFLSQLGYCDLTVNAYVFQLQIWYGSGDYKVCGYAYSAYLNTESSSFIYADSLDNIFCRVNNNSMGDSYVKAGSWMYYKIKDSGNIYYSGTPDTIIIEEHSGTGQLINVN